MSLLTAEQIFAAQDLRHEDVDCPEWGGAVRVQEMSGHLRDIFDAEVRRIRKTEGDDGTVPTAFVVSLCAVGEDGKRLFESAEAVSQLAGKKSEVLNRLFFAALKVSGLSKSESEAIEKNS